MPVQPAVAAAEPPKMQTSIADYVQAPATVRFRRWTSYGNTAYLRGQEAGFTLHEAEMLERRRAADIIHRASHGPAAGMVTK